MKFLLCLLLSLSSCGGAAGSRSVDHDVDHDDVDDSAARGQARVGGDAWADAGADAGVFVDGGGGGGGADTGGDATRDLVTPPRDSGVGNQPLAGKSVLLVAGRLSTAPFPQPVDVLITDRLRGLGATVTLLDDGQLTTPMTAAGYQLVLASVTILRGLSAYLRDAAVPVVTVRGDVGIYLGLFNVTAAGYSPVVKIIAPGHPVAGGLSGVVGLAPSGMLNWGKVVAPGASVIAAVDGAGAADGPAAVVVVCEPGAELLDNVASGAKVAPARRAVYAVGGPTISGFLSDGWRLFDAMVVWAAGGK